MVPFLDKCFSSLRTPLDGLLLKNNLLLSHNRTALFSLNLDINLLLWSITCVFANRTKRHHDFNPRKFEIGSGH